MRTSLGPSARRAEGHGRSMPHQRMPDATEAGNKNLQKEKKKISAGAWEEARALVWKHRNRLAIGLGLMVISRLAGLVLPTSTKYLMDDVVGQQNWDLLPTLALAVAAATLVESVTSFTLSQVLGVAAQRAITEMRKEVEAHVM